jgi:hypothetical protein
MQQQAAEHKQARQQFARPSHAQLLKQLKLSP